MSNIYIPSTCLEDWQKGLSDPIKHWKDGFSAKLTAESWSSAKGFPKSIRDAFAEAGSPFSCMTSLLILPEHKVAIPPSNGHPTQADVWVLASHDTGLASISVEGKKEESFGPTVEDWSKDSSEGKVTRLAFLTNLLGLPAQPPGNIRYQFLHRAAGAIVEAQRFRANIAILLVQSFSDNDAGLADFNNFVGLFGRTVNINGFVQIGQPHGISMYAGWVKNEP